MDNLQETNIHIISIGAEKLANPNWDIEEKILSFRNVRGSYEGSIKPLHLYEPIADHPESDDCELDDSAIGVYGTEDVMDQFLTDDGDIDMDKYFAYQRTLPKTNYKSKKRKIHSAIDDDYNLADDFRFEDFLDENHQIDMGKIREYYINKYSSLLPKTDFYKINEEERDSLYSGSLPVSLDILKLKRKFPSELYTENKKTGEKKVYKGDDFSKTEGEKLYTDAIINVTFDKILKVLPK
jgi:hypothetical protein